METKIRNATLTDLPSLLDFARIIGRYLSADEIRTWLRIDPEALFVAELLPGGKLIGCCCGTRLTPELGFMGFYLVLEEFRGKGIGLKLWKAAKGHLGNRNIGVHGDPVNFKKYKEKEGFCHVEEYVILYCECFGDTVPKNIIPSIDIEVATYFEGHLIDCCRTFSTDSNSATEHEAHVARKRESHSQATLRNRDIMKSVIYPVEFLISEKLYNENKSSEPKYVDEFFPSNVSTEDTEYNGFSNVEHKRDSNICTIKSLKGFQDISINSMNLTAEENLKGEEILSGVFAFDELLHNRNRSSIVQQTFSWSSCQTKVALTGDKVVGYACLRRVVTDHWIISPFYADSEDIAEMLLFELLQGFDFSQASKGILIRFPDKNIAGKRIIEKFGFRKTASNLLTGFTKQRINIDTSKIYSFHSTAFCSD